MRRRPAWEREAWDAVVGELGGPPDVVLTVANGAVEFASAFGASARRLHVPAPLAAGTIGSAALSLVGDASSAETRRRILADVLEAVRPGGVVAVVDHNRPRRTLQAAAALLRRPRVPGVTPAARWRRAARSVARELQAAGATVERLRLAAGERLQIVVARAAVPADGPPPGRGPTSGDDAAQ